jgi:hypothetical protein
LQSHLKEFARPFVKACEPPLKLASGHSSRRFPAATRRDNLFIFVKLSAQHILAQLVERARQAFRKNLCQAAGIKV